MVSWIKSASILGSEQIFFSCQQALATYSIRENNIGISSGHTMELDSNLHRLFLNAKHTVAQFDVSHPDNSI